MSHSTSTTRQESGWPTHEELDNARWHEKATRRFVLKTGAGAAAALSATVPLAGRTIVRAQDTADGTAEATTGTVCVLTPEMTEGPFYLDDMLVRDDITEGKAGIPMALTITVVDGATCAPLENAAVDIWHCDVRGFYSGFVDADPDSQDPNPYQDDGSDPNTFLRGVLLTDANGNVTFNTIYPGWYQGRAVHIHMSVHAGGAVEDGTYDGGTTAHTGQLAFSDAFTERIAAYEPYASRVSSWTTVADDGIFSGITEDDPTYFLAFTPVDENDLSLGVNATITVGVDTGA